MIRIQLQTGYIEVKEGDRKMYKEITKCISNNINITISDRIYIPYSSIVYIELKEENNADNTK